MPIYRPGGNLDPQLSVTDYQAVEQLGDAILLGNWFVFLKAEWLARSGVERLLPPSTSTIQSQRSSIAFRGKEALNLPGVRIAPSTLPRPDLLSLTSDKALYRAGRDTVYLLIVAPLRAKEDLLLTLYGNGNPYSDYTLALDEYGLCLFPLRDLPEGEYVATLSDTAADACTFEVAEYRLAPLFAELRDQQLRGDTLRYVLSVSTFNQPYRGVVEVELQERGQRVGGRVTLHCNREGECRGSVKLSGAGPFTLNLFAAERTATVMLKGSEATRRETLTISELGEVREVSLLPLPQSNACRGLYITRGGANTEPFLVQRVVGAQVEIMPRVDAELLQAVVVNPARGTFEEQRFEGVKANQPLHLPIPAPYGIVLLGAFVKGEAWEGWCAVLRPSQLQFQCAAPAEAKPGSNVQISLKTGDAGRVVPVQLLVKDQRLIAHGDPQVELAARIKQNLTTWREGTKTGKVERELAQAARPPRPMLPRQDYYVRSITMPTMVGSATGPIPPVPVAPASAAPQAPQQAAPELARVRMRFPEVIYNAIIYVKGEAQVEVQLGEGMTRYSVEAFALSPDTLDWQRAETTINAVQSVFGELTVSPFVYPGDSVMGRLDVYAASGGAIVEIRHDDEILPLFHENGSPVAPGLPVPSASVLRFPLRPGTITASVRDARKGGIDVSERYVTAPGRLRHIARRLRLLTPGEELSLDSALELKPLPGLERPFRVVVEGASQYPHGCVEQTTCKLLAMFTGYLTYRNDPQLARDYESALHVWFKRLQSMYLPRSGFCLYPPAEGGSRRPDTHYAPLAVRHLLLLPSSARSDLRSSSLLTMLGGIEEMVRDAAAYYQIKRVPEELYDCQDAYQVISSAEASPPAKARAASFVRSQLIEEKGQVFVQAPNADSVLHIYGRQVWQRTMTAYAAAALLLAGEPGDLARAIATTNYVTGQLNEHGRLYSTLDTTASLALMLALRGAGVVASSDEVRIALNGKELSLTEALSVREPISSLRCISGMLAVQITSEVFEDWSTFKGELPFEVRLEKEGQAQEHFLLGDELDLVIRVANYEPGLLAHVCLPDALARVVGGVQVKRFSLDFAGRNELRVPLAAVGATHFKDSDDPLHQSLHSDEYHTHSVHHWSVIVRNMFKEELVGNPGLLQVEVEIPTSR